MATHTQIYATNSFYFITFTCYKWLPLFEDTKLYDYIPQWVCEMSRRGVKTSLYVVMPNHIHLVVYLDDICKNPNKIIGDAKRFMAYEIVNRLKKNNHLSTLKKLRSGVQENEKNKGKIHQIFRLSFDAKEVKDRNMMNNVMNYIHRNPSSGKWNLIEDYTEYPYSSAGFYENGKKNDALLFDFRNYL